MKDLILVLMVLLLAFGCSSSPSPTTPEEAAIHSLDLQAEWQRLRPKHEGRNISYDNCPPVPLPEVTYRIGQVMSSVSGETRVPVYLDTNGLPTNGGLLSVVYDTKHMSAVRLEPGEAWKNADFVYTAENAVGSHFIWLILGWELQYGEACPLPASRLDEPFAYMVFHGIKPGKSKIEWPPVPDDSCYDRNGIEYCFYRRGETLVTVKDCEWDVIDFYSRNGINTTGKMAVEPGYAIMVGP